MYNIFKSVSGTNVIDGISWPKAIFTTRDVSMKTQWKYHEILNFICRYHFHGIFIGQTNETPMKIPWNHFSFCTFYRFFIGNFHWSVLWKFHEIKIHWYQPMKFKISWCFHWAFMAMFSGSDFNAKKCCHMLHYFEWMDQACMCRIPYGSTIF